jgi:hypothetical protein
MTPPKNPADYLKMGRPTTLTQELADIIIEEVARGEKSLREIASQNGIDHHCQIIRWTRNNPDFGMRYASAREIGTESEVEDFNADLSQSPRLLANGAVDSGWVNWQRHRADNKKWLFKVRNPEKYGDKLQSTHLVQINMPGSIAAMFSETAQLGSGTIEGEIVDGESGE